MKNQVVFVVLKNENLLFFAKAFEEELGKINLIGTEVVWNETNVITVSKNGKSVELELVDHLEAVQWACLLRNYISSSNKTVFVSPTEKGAHRTIASAISAADDYDMILIESGVYMEDHLIIDKPLLIYGAGNVGIECKDFFANCPLYLNHLSIKSVKALQYLNVKDCHIGDLSCEGSYDVYNSRVLKMTATGCGYLKDTIVIQLENQGEIVLNLSLIENNHRRGLQHEI
jgi:hypothetical protein